MERYLYDCIRQDLGRKMVVLTGPRQVGKTTLSQQLLAESSGGRYLNFDVAAHRKLILEQSWRQSAQLLVRECRAEGDVAGIQIRDAAPWLMALDA